MHRGRGNRTVQPTLATSLQPRRRSTPSAHPATVNSSADISHELAVNSYLQTAHQQHAAAEQKVATVQQVADNLATLARVAQRVRGVEGMLFNRSPSLAQAYLTGAGSSYWRPPLQQILAAIDANPTIPVQRDDVVRWQQTMERTQRHVDNYNVRRIARETREVATAVAPTQADVQAQLATLQQQLQQQTILLENLEVAAAISQHATPDQETLVRQALEHLPQDILDWQHNKYPNTLARFRVWCRLTDTKQIFDAIPSAATQPLQQQLAVATRNWMDPDAASIDDWEQIQYLLERVPKLQHAFHALDTAEQATDLQQVLAQRRTPR